MTDTFIQLPTDGTGKKHRSWENTVGTDDVHATAGVITAPDGTVLSGAEGVEVQGNVASGAADSGDPVKVGGVYNSGGAFFTDGQRGDLQMSEVGAVFVAAATDAGSGRAKMWMDNGSSGILLVDAQGNVQSGTPDGGYPVKVGGRYDSVLPTLGNGHRGNLQLDENGRVIIWAIPAGTNNIGDVDVASLPGTVAADITAIKAAIEILDNAIAGSEMQVDIVSGAQPVYPATATLSNVADQASNVQLIALNAARLGAMIFNDSTESLFVKFGSAASATSFTVKILAGGYFEFPQPVYTGRVDGVWANDASGSARITELTA